MTVTHVEKHFDTLTMTVTAEFDGTVDRVWQLYADPRKLERWWGPPTYPATFTEHDLTPGSVCTYFMTGPEGNRSHGWWKVLDVEAPRRFTVQDGFGESPDQAPADMPTMRMTVELHELDGGRTRAVILSEFASVEQIQQLLDMGMEEGLKAAMGQMDDVLTSIPA
ncbi:MAG: SRPBCC family protein [Ilumatobacteraceae bacterium]